MVSPELLGFYLCTQILWNLHISFINTRFLPLLCSLKQLAQPLYFLFTKARLSIPSHDEFYTQDEPQPDTYFVSLDVRRLGSYEETVLGRNNEILQKKFVKFPFINEDQKE
jgi:hypothetical protein